MKDGKGLIVTIGRQSGSGGSEIGRQLATELGLGFHDKNILRMDSDESGTKESLYYMAGKKAENKLLYKIVKGMTSEIGSPSLGSDPVSADDLFRFQLEVIRKPAAEGDCVFIKRRADYVLEGTEGLVWMFLYGDMDCRVRRTTEKEYFGQKDIKKDTERNDRECRDYYRYYTGQDWQNTENYDVMLNTTVLGTEGMVRAVKVYLRTRGCEL